MQNNGGYESVGSPAGGYESVGSPATSSPVTQISGGLSDASSALNIYNGLQRGGVAGYAGAALSAGKLANNVGAFGASSNAGQYLGAAGSVLGIYNGLQRGGVMGYTTAGLDTAILAGQVANLTAGGAAAAASAGGAVGAASAAGAAAGAVALPLAGFAALYGIDAKQSQLSAASQMNDASSTISGLQSQIKGLQDGTVPNQSGISTDDLIASLQSQIESQQNYYNLMASGANPNDNGGGASSEAGSEMTISRNYIHED